MRPTVLVLASTYPRWANDPEPAFVHELSRRLARDHEVIAVVPDAPGADPSGDLDGVHVVRYRYAPRAWQTLVNDGGIATHLRRSPWKWLLVPGFVLGQYLAARRVLKRHRVTVIHAHWIIPQGWLARWLARPARIPVLVTSHGGDLFGFRGRLLTRVKRSVAAACSRMTVVSDAMRKEAIRLGLRPPSLTVLPMGVDLQRRYVPDPSVPRSADELLFVGRLVPKKGLPLLLNALPAVLARRPAASLTIAGFGPERADLEAQASRLGVAHAVRFLGAVPQDRLPDLYRRASLFVAPFVRDESGNQEGLPVVLMEAIGCGCPAIVGDVAGLDDLLGGHAAYVTVNPRDRDALAEAILDALDQPGLALARAVAIRGAVAEKVDWDVIAQGYRRELQACMANLGELRP
ncbi:MAG: glycosyl transferase [Lysobacterales bacterium 14-68-21]|jgi:glycosyltransferase involved in cell wall biosynthesis|nr:MAG: glycosyl transferase [Xanthomonadales bacterium 15-68-25]OZB68008.1 MAG: glycosyl transferase [Xanthomonadales bacterium 14-68-21]